MMRPVHFAPTQFPAPVERTKTIGDFTLSETRYGGEATLPVHGHEYACLVFAVEGAFHERSESCDRTIAPGTVIFRPPAEPHSNRFARSGGRCLNVEVAPQWLLRTDQALTSAALSSMHFALLGRRLCDELIATDDASPLAVESIIVELLGDAATHDRVSSSPPPWLMRAKEIVHDRMTERFTLSMIAGEVGVHPVHLASTFRRFYGQSVGAYLRDLRIDAACGQLIHTDRPLADIATGAGFSDQSHFGRTFKRIMRATPHEYRARGRRP